MIVNSVKSSATLYSSNVATSRYVGATANVRGARKSDEFTPSAEAQTFSEMLNQLKNTAEVRQDRVNELEQKISSGQYAISAENIAASLLNNRF